MLADVPALTWNNFAGLSVPTPTLPLLVRTNGVVSVSYTHLTLEESEPILTKALPPSVPAIIVFVPSLAS